MQESTFIPKGGGGAVGKVTTEPGCIWSLRLENVRTSLTECLMAAPSSARHCTIGRPWDRSINPLFSGVKDRLQLTAFKPGNW